jgi:hypothetical protein
MVAGQQCHYVPSNSSVILRIVVLTVPAERGLHGGARSGSGPAMLAVWQ